MDKNKMQAICYLTTHHTFKDIDLKWKETVKYSMQIKYPPNWKYLHSQIKEIINQQNKNTKII